MMIKNEGKVEAYQVSSSRCRVLGAAPIKHSGRVQRKPGSRSGRSSTRSALVENSCSREKSTTTSSMLTSRRAFRRSSSPTTSRVSGNPCDKLSALARLGLALTSGRKPLDRGTAVSRPKRAALVVLRAGRRLHPEEHGRRTARKPGHREHVCRPVHRCREVHRRVKRGIRQRWRSEQRSVHRSAPLKTVLRSMLMLRQVEERTARNRKRQRRSRRGSCPSKLFCTSNRSTLRRRRARLPSSTMS